MGGERYTNQLDYGNHLISKHHIVPLNIYNFYLLYLNKAEEQNKTTVFKKMIV